MYAEDGCEVQEHTHKPRRKSISWRNRITRTLFGIEHPMPSVQLQIRCGVTDSTHKTAIFQAITRLINRRIVSRIGFHVGVHYYLTVDHNKFKEWIRNFENDPATLRNPQSHGDLLKEGKKRNKEHGLATGGSTPYGKRRVCCSTLELEDEPKELEAVTIAKALWKYKRISYEEIARSLAARGYYNRAGNKFQSRSVHNMIAMKIDVEYIDPQFLKEEI